METYLISGNVPPPGDRLIVLPPDPIEPADVVLRDADKRKAYEDARRGENIEGFLRIYREGGEHELEFHYCEPNFEPMPPLSLRSKSTFRFRERFARWLRYRRDWIVRIFVWNIQYPLRRFVHFKFFAGRQRFDSPYHLQVLLREAFSKEGITDTDIPYGDGMSGPGGECGYSPDGYGPGKYDLIWNRKRVAQQ